MARNEYLALVQHAEVILARSDEAAQGDVLTGGLPEPLRRRWHLLLDGSDGHSYSSGAGGAGRHKRSITIYCVNRGRTLLIDCVEKLT